jgi:Fur family iron response transcriptional regulator
MTTKTMKRSSAWLATGNLRPTRQRLTLAELLVGDGENRHVTAESLHAATSTSAETVLRAFCDAGLIREVMVDGTKSYFDTRVDDHPHFFWEDTRELTDAPKEELKIAGLPDAPDGTEISKVDVVIRLRKT